MNKPFATNPTAEIIQARRDGKTRLTLVSNEELEIEHIEKRNRNSFRIKLSELTSETSESCYRAPHFNFRVVAGLILTAVFGIPMIGFMFSEIKAAAMILSFIAIPFGWWTLSSFRELRGTGYSILVYSFRSGRPAFSIDIDSPTREAQVDFKEALDQAINEAAPVNDLATRNRSLSGDLGRLNHLRRDGLLSDAEFASAKERLISGAVQEKRPIGFVGAN